MKIRLVRHAKNKIRRLKVSFDTISEMINSPHQVTKDDKGHLLLMKKIEDKVFVMVVDKKEEEVTIITVFEKREKGTK